MAIRIGIYDFFAYTVPGILYILVTAFWVNAFGLAHISLDIIKEVSASWVLLLAGAGFVVGLLLDPIAYAWFRLFRKRNSQTVRDAYMAFQRNQKGLVFGFGAEDWHMLLSVIKSRSLDIASDIEQHNVANIMLRNISFGLAVTSLACFLYFVAVSSNPWNLFISALGFYFAYIALDRSGVRRDWFYTAIYESFVAHSLAADPAGLGQLLRVELIPSGPAGPQFEQLPLLENETQKLNQPDR